MTHEIDKRALDDYITGINIHYEDDAVLHRCKHCGNEKRLPMFFELGGWFYLPEFEDESFCCDDEMEIIEETPHDS